MPTLNKSSNWYQYYRLFKPRVMTLVIFTAWVGMVIAPSPISIVSIIIGIACIAVNAGAAGAFNMVIERHTDKLMKRTENRPLATGKICYKKASLIAIILTLASTIVTAVCFNILSAALLLFANFFYVVVYTKLLKPRTPQNIVIGGAAGAFPPMIGWAMASGDITITSTIMFLIIFLWTPPHFWALSIYCNDDYKAAGIPMMPVIKGIPHTTKLMVIYCVALIPVVALPTAVGTMGYFYGILATILTILFLILSIIVYKDPVKPKCIRMFVYSIYYLFAVFGLMVLDKWL